MIRTVGQLRELLEAYDDDAPLRVAIQPSWPLRCAVVGVTDGDEIERERNGGYGYDEVQFVDPDTGEVAERLPEDERRIVWIAVDQVSSYDEHPYAPSEAWRRW